jgi:E3 ubiquitin-protein ligase TRIP12
MNDKTLLQFGSLEFDYVDEEGTGAGPTLEFYSLTAREIRGMKVWRSTGEDCGLFPLPVVAADTEEMFEFLGRFVGKAISDEKVLDLPLSPAFWKLVFSQSLTLSDLIYVDKSLHRYLSDLHEVVARRHWILSNANFSPDVKERQLSQLTYKGTPIPNLALNFTVPGYDLELKPQGKDEFVTLDTLESYIQLVAEMTLMQTTQAAAFRKGLEVLVPTESLSAFSGEELEALVCGEAASVWDLDMLQEAVVPAHGYTKTSAVYQNLLLVMTQLKAQDQKTFLQFVTGAPRLPMGGFKALNPPLTVVRKDTNGPSDSFLPSVMT